MIAKKIRVLAVGAHPDDVELSCGGTVAKMADDGAEVIILDLTRGEMGTFGDAETRAAEALKAAGILGAVGRENLDLGDTALEDNPAQRRKMAAMIRKHRPEIIIAPFWEDYHPDHAAAGRIVRSASSDARLARLDLGFPPHAPRLILHYPAHLLADPTVVVDITDFFEVKMEAVRSYRSQFDIGSREGHPPPVGFRDYLFHVESRCRHFGSLIDRPFAEGFIIERPLEIGHPGDLLSLGEDHG